MITTVIKGIDFEIRALYLDARALSSLLSFILFFFQSYSFQLQILPASRFCKHKMQQDIQMRISCPACYKTIHEAWD